MSGWADLNARQDYCDSPEQEKFMRFLFVWQIHERLQTVTYFDHKDEHKEQIHPAYSNIR